MRNESLGSPKTRSAVRKIYSDIVINSSRVGEAFDLEGFDLT